MLRPPGRNAIDPAEPEQHEQPGCSKQHMPTPSTKVAARSRMAAQRGGSVTSSSAAPLQQKHDHPMAAPLALTAHMLLPAPRWQMTRLHSLSGLPSMRAACGAGRAHRQHSGAVGQGAWRSKNGVARGACRQPAGRGRAGSSAANAFAHFRPSQSDGTQQLADCIQPHSLAAGHQAAGLTCWVRYL